MAKNRQIDYQGFRKKRRQNWHGMASARMDPLAIVAGGKETMKLNELLKELIALADSDPRRLDCEVLTRKPSGELAIVNKAIFQPEAVEIQLFVADC